MYKMDKKVMLTYPNCRWLEDFEDKTIWNLHPYNLCLLSSTIESKYDTKIVDANIDNLSREDFRKAIKDYNPEIIGISVLTDEYGKAGLIAGELAKSVNPKIKTVLGGVHVMSDPESIVKDKNIDYVAIGEGEKVFGELCDYLVYGKEPPKKGISFKKDGKTVNLGRADFIEDLDALPFSSYEKIDFMKYANSIQRESADRPRAMPYAHVITSRGCPYNCCFCQAGKISGKRPRLRSVENVLGEIDWLKKRYGIEAIIFDDDNLLFDKKRAKGIFKGMIDREFNVKWNSIAMAAFKMDDEIIGLMKKSGCQYVDIAIESGVERVLKDVIHKPLNLGHAKRVAKSLKENKLDFAANFIIGFPGETWQEIRKTVEFAEEFDADYTKIFLATPLPNTELYQISKEGGYLNKDFSFNKHLWTDGCINTDEFRSKDLKILRAYEWDRINFSSPEKCKKVAGMMGISLERLNEIRKNTLKRANP